jgi:hypothetical protein
VRLDGEKHTARARVDVVDIAVLVTDEDFFNFLNKMLINLKF